MSKEQRIGVVGGAGPFAGIDLTEKIFSETIAVKDQEHLPMVLFSLPNHIVDRTEFILGKTNTNPAYAVSDIIMEMEKAGVTVAGIPCNTMHSEVIFNVLKDELLRKGCKVLLVNMIQEVIRFIRNNHPGIHSIGVLSTTGTYSTGLYKKPLEAAGFQHIDHGRDFQDIIHDSIYNKEYGIKACSKPVTKKAKNSLGNGIRQLKKEGAQGIILGCTEISYALPYKKLEDIPLFDAAQILARVLIEKTYPDRLRPYSTED